MTLRKSNGFRILLLQLTIIVPFFLGIPIAYGQDRVKAPVKLKIEDGDFDGVSVVLKNNTTGESNSLPGVAKFDLDLKINCDYMISFSKPGYITKRIAFNTSSPTNRTKQGFYPFNFEVNLFKQYDGVNIVVFNQPVGKISFNRLIDDFDYDTDYTKQIQSALKQAEDEIKKKMQEERALADQNKKLEEKRKQEEAAQARADEKARLEAEKKAAEEARLLTATQAKEKKAEEEQRKLQAKATMEEEKRQLAAAKMEEEERAKLKAAEEAEQRAKTTASTGNEINTNTGTGTAGEDKKQVIAGSAGNDDRALAGDGTADIDKPGGRAATGSGDDSRQNETAGGIKAQDKGITQAQGTTGQDNKDESLASDSRPSNAALTETYEKLPGISVEEIVEASRKITRVTVRNNQKETVFSKVVYNWGGVFYFRSNLNITQSLYKSATGLQ